MTSYTLDLYNERGLQLVQDPNRLKVEENMELLAHRLGACRIHPMPNDRVDATFELDLLKEFSTGILTKLNDDINSCYAWYCKPNGMAQVMTHLIDLQLRIQIAMIKIQAKLHDFEPIFVKEYEFGLDRMSCSYIRDDLHLIIKS